MQKIRNLFLIGILLSPICGFSQYSSIFTPSSTYYVEADVNTKVSGTVNVNTRKTITTIDYGALAQANAQREANRIASQKLAIEQSRYNTEVAKNEAIRYEKICLDIAKNPLLALDYGTRYSYVTNYQNKGWKSVSTIGGLKSFHTSMVMPHQSLFQNVGNFRMENISTDGITTEILYELPQHIYSNEILIHNKTELDAYTKIQLPLVQYYSQTEKPIRKNYSNKEYYKFDLQRYINVCDSLDNIRLYYSADFDAFGGYNEGAMNFDGTDSFFTHKKETVRRVVSGFPGYRYTSIWEDKYQICITDYYLSTYNNTNYRCKVRYKADKVSELTFEDLEGRRYYLSKLVDKHIASILIKDIIVSDEIKRIPKRRSFSSSNEFYKALNKWTYPES